MLPVLVTQVMNSISSHGMLGDGDRVVVGVSGGLDSVVLLDVLHALGQSHAWQLKVVHVNHGLRGDESDEDGRFVRGIADKLGLPFESFSLNLAARRKELRPSLEGHARRLRHDCLVEAARSFSASQVALAHHLDDQVELFFMRLFRGAGVKGIAGMKPVSDSPSNPEIHLLRPLLDIEKGVLEDYAQNRGLEFREDPSNHGLDFERNRIRNACLPLLGQFGKPGWKTRIGRLMSLMRLQDAWAEEELQNWLKNGRQPAFELLSPALKAIWVQKQLQALNIPPNYDLILGLVEKPQEARSVSPDSVVLCRPDGDLQIKASTSSEDGSFKTDPLLPSFWLNSDAGSIATKSVRILWKIEQNVGNLDFETKPENCEFYDADKIKSPVFLRFWKPGDRFQPLGSSGSTKVQDLFTNAHVVRAERHRRLIAIDNSGRIFWIQGFPPGELFKLDKSTQRRLKWSWDDLGAAFASG